MCSHNFSFIKIVSSACYWHKNDNSCLFSREKNVEQKLNKSNVKL